MKSQSKYYVYFSRKKSRYKQYSQDQNSRSQGGHTQSHPELAEGALLSAAACERDCGDARHNMSLPPIDASFSWAAREQKPIDPELEAELAALHEELGVERGAGLAGVGTKPELIVPTPPLEMAVASNPLVGSANNEHHEAPQQALSRCEFVVAEAKQSIDAARTAGSPTKEKIAAAQKLVAEARQAHTAMRTEVKQTLQEMQAQLAHDMQACVQTAGTTTPLSTSTSAALEASKR